MPDCLEMPYFPVVRGAKHIAQDDHHSPYIYKLGGNSCLSGDFMGYWEFDHAPQVGENVIFEDMLHYTTVKTNMFNGISHPAIGIARLDGTLEILREYIKGKTICCIISGGNNDINRMPEMEERALIYDGVKHYFIVNFPQRPGALREFVNDILGPNDDITRFEYIKRANKGKGPVLIGIALSDKDDYDGLLERLSAFDPSYINLHGNETLYNMLV